MRPLAGTEAFQPSSRKPSLAEPSFPLTDARSTSPVTFFLRRGSQGNDDQSSMETSGGDRTSPVHNLAETVEALPQLASSMIVETDSDESSQNPRRRSTVKAGEAASSQRSASAKGHLQPSGQEVLTLLDTSSLPSSPKSTSTRSLRPSEANSAGEDSGSQAILSSGDEEAEPGLSSKSAEEAPQLIMPSIRMPSRRPFTERGKHISNLKILVAGSKGVGKTSLIKSIVQKCEDIVHVDPLSVGRSLTVGSFLKGKQVLETPKQPYVFEINASTRPYPSWWSEIEDSKILRRRRSVGDTVLDRNLCFVDTDCEGNGKRIIDYMVMQLQKAILAPTTAGHDFAALLNGSGGPQVDVVFYLLSKDTIDEDISHMENLSELSNVIPLISKADQLSAEQIGTLKLEIRSKFDSTVIPSLPAFSVSDLKSASAPYTVSSATGPDHETMEASLLMSPDYIQPLLPSELALLVQQIFEPDVISYLRHSAAKKLIAWQTAHPQSTMPTSPARSPTSFSPRPSSLASPLPHSLSNSGVLIPFASDLSLAATSNSQAMTRLAEHAQQEERLAQVRLSKWADELQSSLQRERERFEKLARGERAIWLVEKMGEEAKGGRLSVFDQRGALIRAGHRDAETSRWSSAKCSTHDPLGLLRWSDNVRARGWVALQVMGSFGVIGGLAFWLARTWGLTSAIHEWAHAWSWNGFGMGWYDAESMLT